MTVPALDLYDVTVWVKDPGRPQRIESEIAGVSYDAAREILHALGPFSYHVEALARGVHDRDGRRVKRQLSYVPAGVFVHPARHAPYGECDIELSGGVAAYGAGYDCEQSKPSALACRHCGQPVTRDPGGWVHLAGGALLVIDCLGGLGTVAEPQEG